MLETDLLQTIVYTFDQFIADHKSQLLSSNVPKHFWRRLYESLENNDYSAGNYFVFNKLLDISDCNEKKFSWELVAKKPLSTMDKNGIFLIDHAVSFTTEYELKKKLNFNYLKRLAEMTGINFSQLVENNDNEEIAHGDIVDQIVAKVWKIVNFYKVHAITSSEQETETNDIIFYVQDEVGSALCHSDHPNCGVAPFYYVKSGICYNTLWPIKDLIENDVLTVDTIPNVDANERRFRLAVKTGEDLREDITIQRFCPSTEYFEDFRMKEIHPEESQLLSIASPPIYLEGSFEEKILVYSDISLIRSYLTDNRFLLVKNQEEAQILWMYQHFKDFKSLYQRPRVTFINQFPSEAVFTVKDMLATIGRNCWWLPLTFNLKYELGSFIQYFQEKEKMESSRNVWILKPWNLGRSIGIVITSNLDQILLISQTLPMIASRYITEPVLFFRSDLGVSVKFDIRYMLVMKSFDPLICYVTKQFWLRFANQEFSLDGFDNIEKHLTVMNYAFPDKLKNIHCDVFIMEFEKQYPAVIWNKDIETKIFAMFHDVVKTITMSPPPMGVLANPLSCAIYAVDLMLEWQEIEMTFMTETVFIIKLGSLFIQIGILGKDSRPQSYLNCVARRKTSDIIGSPKRICNELEWQAALSSDAYLMSLLQLSGNKSLTETEPKISCQSSDFNQFLDSCSTEVENSVDISNLEPVLFGEDARFYADKYPNDYSLSWPIQYQHLNVQESITVNKQNLVDILAFHIKQRKLPEGDIKKCVVIIPDVFKRRDCRYLMEAMLENLNFAYCIFHVNSLCILHSLSLPNACIVDIGHQCTTITCIIDGVVLEGARIQVHFGGLQCDLFIQKQLGKKLDALSCMKFKRQYCRSSETTNVSGNLPFNTARSQQLPSPPFSSLSIPVTSSVDMVSLFPQLLVAKFPSTLGENETEINVITDYPMNRDEMCPDDPFDDVYVTLTTRERKKRLAGDIKDEEERDDNTEEKELGKKSLTDNRAQSEATKGVADDVAKSEKLISASTGNSDESAPRITASSIPEAIVETILLCDPLYRNCLINSIFLVGGCSAIPNLMKMMQMAVEEVFQQVPPNAFDISAKVCVYSLRNQQDCVSVGWKGASYIAKVPFSEELWISVDEWKRYGSRTLREKAPFAW